MQTPLKATKVDVTPRGHGAKYGMELIMLDTDHWKSWVHERLAWPDDQLGAWHLPADTDDNYMKQIVSESRTQLASGRALWIEHSKENHFLDCEAMQAAAAHMLNVARIAPPTERRRPPPSAKPPPATPPAHVINVGRVNQQQQAGRRSRLAR
jgi:phage terminase large subunit GpA-like protein